MRHFSGSVFCVGGWLLALGVEGFLQDKLNACIVRLPYAHVAGQPPTSMAGTDVVGWYRRHIPSATAAQATAAAGDQLNLGLGTVGGSAQVFLNGAPLNRPVSFGILVRLT